MNAESYGRLKPLDALNPAWSHAKKLLFPFNIGTWLTIGLIVFLEQLASGAGNVVNGSRQIPSLFKGVTSPVDVANAIDKAIASASARSGLIAAIAIPAGLLLVVLFLFLLWVSVRAQLTLAYTVSTERIGLGNAWKQTAPNVASLFKFHLVLAAINWLLVIALLASLGWGTYRLLRVNETSVMLYFLTLGPIVLVWAVIALVPGVIKALLRSFVVPVMIKKGITGTEGFRELMPVLKNSVGDIIVYFVLQWLFMVGVAFVMTVVTFVTCCIGALPVVAQTIFAPFWVFERAWSMFMLKKVGPEFDVFEQASEPSTSTPPPAQHEWKWTDSR